MTNTAHPFDSIPFELKTFKAWVVWRYIEREAGKKPTKVPFDALTQTAAAVNNSATWSTYNDAIQAYSAHRYDGIGFVLSEYDPYTVIDLDDTDDALMRERELNLTREINSYTEISPSGRGLHIWARGSVPHGRNRRPIEIYSTGRFVTVTGDVYTATFIEEKQDLITQLYNQLSPPPSITAPYEGGGLETQTDVAVCDAAYAAKNGDKFKDLYVGDWGKHYSSQSEADFALVDILAFYTESFEQVKRIFLASALGKRDKATRDDYTDKMVKRAFDKHINLNPAALIHGMEKMKEDFEALNAPPVPPVAAPVVAAPVTPAIADQLADSKYTIPNGLLGAIADFIYKSSPRPVLEVALGGAIGLMAGICGKAYNVSGTGLNQYVFVLAPTGIGKEGMTSGINKLIFATRTLVPSCTKFIGAGQIASPQALLRFASKESPSFVCPIGEAGMWLRQISDPRAAPALVGIRRVLLDLYNKSGAGNVVSGTIYADGAKDIGLMIAPAVSLLGDTTPERFYEGLDDDLIAEGFIPRLTTLEYTGIRPPTNKNHTRIVPDAQLIDILAELSQNALRLNEANAVINVVYTQEAEDYLDELDRFCDAQINNTGVDVQRQLWSRAHMKTLKMAALVAVGANIYQPTITLDHAKWAQAIVFDDTYRLIKHFDAGLATANGQLQETGQSVALARCIAEYASLDENRLKSYGEICVTLRHYGIVPHQYLSRRLLNTKLFKTDRRGATIALQVALKNAQLNGAVVEVTRNRAANEFNFTGQCYAIASHDAVKVMARR